MLIMGMTSEGAGGLNEDHVTGLYSDIQHGLTVCERAHLMHLH